MASELEQTNRDLVQQIWDSIDRGEMDDLDAILDENVVLRVPGKPAIRGREEYKEYTGDYRQAFPDSSVEIHEMFLDDDTVISHFTWRGTHQGEFEGIEATGVTVEVPGVTINRCNDGRVTEDINFWDNLEFMEQLGVVESDFTER